MMALMVLRPTMEHQQMILGLMHPPTMALGMPMPVLIQLMTDLDTPLPIQEHQMTQALQPLIRLRCLLSSLTIITSTVFYLFD